MVILIMPCPVTGFPRVREQDPGPVQRDGVDPAGHNRRQQATRDDAKGRRGDQGVQGQGPGHLRVGDPRQVALGRRLRQVQRALGELHQPHTTQQDRYSSAPERAVLRSRSEGGRSSRESLQLLLPVHVSGRPDVGSRWRVSGLGRDAVAATDADVLAADESRTGDAAERTTRLAVRAYNVRHPATAISRHATARVRSAAWWWRWRPRVPARAGVRQLRTEHQHGV